MRLKLLISFIFITTICFGQANINRVRSYDSTFTITNQAFPDDTLFKFTKGGMLIKYTSNVPADTVMFKSETTDTSQYALKSDSANYADTAKYATNAIADSVFSVLEATDTLITPYIKSNANLYVEADTVEYITNDIKLGNTVIDSNSIDVDTINTIVLEAKDNTIYMRNILGSGSTMMGLGVDNLFDVKIFDNPSYTNEVAELHFGLLGPESTYSNYRNTYDGDNYQLDFIHGVWRFVCNSNTYSFLENELSMPNQALKPLSIIYTDGTIQNSAYDSLIVSNSNTITLQGDTLFAEEENIKAKTLSVSDEFSIGGGDVITNSDTTLLKDAVEAESFGNITMDSITVGNIIRAAGQITDNDATPDVSGASIWTYNGTANSVTITDLDNPTVGETYIIIGNSDTYTLTINDGGNFHIGTNVTLGIDDVIHIYVQADNDYIDLGRKDN